MNVKSYLGGLFGAGLMVCAAGPAMAAVAGELIKNGSFSTTTATQSTQIDTAGNVANWSNSGYNFIYLAAPGTISGTEADNRGTTNGVKLWGPGNGVFNGLTTSADGGNFVAADDNYQTGAISQSVSGLTVGTQYLLSFLWAGAQQSGFYGATQDQWTVTFGSQQQKTANITVAEKGFSGWMRQTFLFTAGATTQTLSFLATGTPGGNPPFALLDGVSLVAAPEPATIGLVAAGLFGAGAAGFRRRRSASKGSAA